MLGRQNPWKQYALLLLGAALGLISYQVARYYTWTDVMTAVKYTIDLYNMHVYIRVPVLIVLSAISLTLLVYLVLKLWNCMKIHRKSKKRTAAYLSEKEYQRQTKEVTEQELRKLFNSVEYKRATEQKGDALQNWNWQTAERLQRERTYKSAAKVNPREEEEEKGAISA